MQRLARLVDTRAKWILTSAAVLFLAAGVLGAGVADHLDPFGADDPATESVIATEQLQDAGFRPTSVVVLSRTRSPNCSPRTESPRN
jgi:hypothetical protein